MGVVLSKGQKISLDKEAGQKLDRVVMGLGWDTIKKKGLFGLWESSQDVDLDASCLMFDAAHQLIDVVFFNHLKSEDGSVQHTGDNRTGAGEGDDEQISLSLSRVPLSVTSLVFVVNSFTGQDFSQIANASCRLINSNGNKELAVFNLSAQGSHTAQIMAKLYRHNGEWKMHAIGENARGRTFVDLVPSVIPHL
ncbi:MAG: TerD family protein [Actinobacteria bacterium]|nr:TerD family protein [Actinomycetota bacterium]